jgi:hypothetical protein
MSSSVSKELWQQVTGTTPDESARGLLVSFEYVAVMDDARSAEEGRPVFVDKEFIEIRSPNDPNSVVHREADHKDRATYPQTYKAWKDGAAEALSGTPLKKWTYISASQVALLGFRGIRTVEQFVDVSDDGCHQLGHGFLELRNKAQVWLKDAKDSSSSARHAAELEARDSRIRDLERQVKEIATRQAERDEQSPPPKKSKQQASAAI